MKKAFLLVFLVTQIWASDKISMAVYDFDASGIKQEDASSVADFIQEGLMLTGRFNLIDRKDVQRLLKEQMFSKTGCTSTECAVEVGKLLNVSNIVTGKVSQMGTRTVISIRLVDVESGKIALLDSVECGSVELLNTGSKALAEHFSKGVAVKGKVLKVTGNDVIIGLGMDDGLKNGDILTVERYGEAVKDDTGKIAFQEKTKIGMVVVKDAAKAGSKAQITESQGSIKNGDVVELKVEKLRPLDPILNANDNTGAYTPPPSYESENKTVLRKFGAKPRAEENNEEAPSGFSATYEFGGYFSFLRTDTSNATIIPMTPVGTFYNHFTFALEFGTSVSEYLTISSLTTGFIYPGFKTLSDVEDDSRRLYMFSEGLTLRFYPFVGLINPSFAQYKKVSQQRGAFQPYFSVTGNLYLGLFNADYYSTAAIQIPIMVLFGGGMELRGGFEVANVFYVECLWRLLSNASGTTTIYDWSDVELGEQTYSFNVNTIGIGAGFRF